MGLFVTNDALEHYGADPDDISTTRLVTKMPGGVFIQTPQEVEDCKKYNV